MVARRHHYVPKCYLNSFSNENENKKKRELYVFERVERKLFVTAPDDVALERDFNTINLEGHAPDAFEAAMAAVESEIGPALKRIIESKSIADNDDRVLLINLICLLYVRNPRFRKTKQSLQDRVAKIVMDLVLSSREMWESQVKKAQAAGFVAKDVETNYEDVKRGVENKDHQVQIPIEDHLLSEIHVFDHALPLLFERKWVLLRATPDSKGFITCDHPVSLIWSEPTAARRPLGLKTTGTEILFPISPELAVVGAFELENGVHESDKIQVASCNGTTILNSNRQVYAIREDFDYQIDQTMEPRSSAGLLKDESFLVTK
jgi:hypothetical protein